MARGLDDPWMWFVKGDEDLSDLIDQMISHENVRKKTQHLNSKALFGLKSEFEVVNLSWFEIKICRKLSCLN